MKVSATEQIIQKTSTRPARILLEIVGNNNLLKLITMSEQQQPGDAQQAPQMTPEMFRNTQEIAAQAAMRAQQLIFRKTAGSEMPRKTPPEVPARGDSMGKIPPEIPPKRSSLRKHSVDEAKVPPPPLPLKPASAQSSPLVLPKFSKEPPKAFPPPPIGMRPQPLGTPQMVAKFEKPTAIASAIPTQPLNQASHPMVSNGLKQAFSLRGAINSPQLGRKVGPPPPTRTTPQRAPVSPTDDSEDALRGIESGLRNMERAMQEQMNLRSLEAAQQQLDGMTFSAPIDFKQTLRSGGSINSLDGSSNQSLIENMRMTLNKNMRSMERGISMEQMRMENIGGSGGGGMRSMDSNPNMRAAIEELKSRAYAEQQPQQRPMENHMKSLDRSLPLELQYSRHHRSQSHEIAEQLRQTFAANAANVMGVSGGGGGNVVGGGGRSNTGSLSREDVRLRRRSSHDENQMSQDGAGNVSEKNAEDMDD